MSVEVRFAAVKAATVTQYFCKTVGLFGAEVFKMARSLAAEGTGAFRQPNPYAHFVSLSQFTY